MKRGALFISLLLGLLSSAYAQFSAEKLEKFYVEDFEEQLSGMIQMTLPMYIDETMSSTTLIYFADGNYPEEFQLVFNVGPLEKREALLRSLIDRNVAAKMVNITNKKVVEKEDLEAYIYANLHPNHIIALDLNYKHGEVEVYELEF